jgi:predicted ATPase
MLEVELQLALGRVMLNTNGSADVEAGKVFEKAVALCRGLDRIELLTRALWGYWFNKAHRRELTLAENAAQELLTIGQQKSDTPAQSVAHSMLGITDFWRGRFKAARLNLQPASELCRTGEHTRVDLAIVSNHLDIHVSMQLSLTLTCLGILDAAADQWKHALSTAHGLAHLPLQAITLGAACRQAWFVRDDGRLRETTTALVELSEEQAFPFYLALGRCHMGWLEVKEGHIEQGLSLLRTGLAGLQSSDALIWAPYTRSMMPEAQAWAGNLDDAERLLDGALWLSARTGGLVDAELFRLKGQVLLMRPSPDHESAEALFRRTIAVAHSQSAMLWELRAATGLARLWSGQGKRNEASALLAPLHAGLTEGRETPDMKDAAALLAELAG